MQGKTLVKRITYLAAFSAVAIILGYVEALLPINFGIPGVKLGLANLVTVIMFYSDNFGFKLKDIIIVCLVRIITVGFLFGNMYGIIYSLCGGLLSLIIMYIFYGFRVLGTLGISIVGGIFHNIGQLLVAMFVVKELKIIYYAPVLLLSGSITGCLIGLLSGLVLLRLKRIKIYD